MFFQLLVGVVLFLNNKSISGSCEEKCPNIVEIGQVKNFVFSLHLNYLLEISKL